MARDNHLEHQKRIVNRIKDNGNGPAVGLTAEQAAAQQAIRAVAALMALVETINIKNADLAGLAATWGSRHLANDTGLWSLATVNDWIKFDNELANAGAALYLAADLRGMKLHQLIMARVNLDAEIKRRESHLQRR